MTDLSLADLKSRLRAEGLVRRDALDPDRRAAASLTIAESVLSLPELRESEPVGGYWPMRSEVDPRPILTALSRRGCVVALPQTRHPELCWRRWRPGDALVPGGFKVMEPAPEAVEVQPRALLVPLCSFDRRGGRLGYGKGHFDRAIAGLSSRHRLVTIGLAFAAQEIEFVPMEDHDRVLDVIVTERDILRPSRGRA